MMQSNEDHAVLSDFFTSKRKFKTEGYQNVYLMHNVFLFLVDCLLQQRTNSKQYKIPTKSSTPVGLSDPAVLMSFQTEIEVSQLPALSQHSCKPLCPLSSEIIIVTQIKVHQRCQSLRQHSCKPLCILSFHFKARQLECGDAAPDCHHHELPLHKLYHNYSSILNQ